MLQTPAAIRAIVLLYNYNILQAIIPLPTSFYYENSDITSSSPPISTIIDTIDTKSKASIKLNVQLNRYKEVNKDIVTDIKKNFYTHGVAKSILINILLNYPSKTITYFNNSNAVLDLSISKYKYFIKYMSICIEDRSLWESTM